MFHIGNGERIQRIGKHLELHFVFLMGRQLSKKMECQNTSYPYRSQRSYVSIGAGVEIEQWNVLWKSYLILLFANISEIGAECCYVSGISARFLFKSFYLVRWHVEFLTHFKNKNK